MNIFAAQTPASGGVMSQAARARLVRVLDDAVRGRGACAGAAEPDDWYPEPGDTAAADRAIQVCRRCPAIADCLRLSALIPAGRYGVWGGTTEQDRRRPAPEPVPVTTPEERRRELAAPHGDLVRRALAPILQPGTEVAA